MSQYQLQTRIGSNSAGSGSEVPGYASKPHGDLVVAQGKGRYYESSSRGKVFNFYLNAISTTVAAGNIEAAAANASTQFALWNPLASGVNISLLKFGLGVISGTPTGGAVTHSFYATAPTIASAGTAPVGMNLGSQVCTAGYMAAAAGTSLTGGSALKVLRMADFSSTATAQGSVGLVKSVEDLAGDILLPPGTGWAPTWRGAGTTLLCSYSIMFEEIPIP